MIFKKNIGTKFILESVRYYDFDMVGMDNYVSSLRIEGFEIAEEHISKFKDHDPSYIITITSIEDFNTIMGILQKDLIMQPADNSDCFVKTYPKIIIYDDYFE